MGRTMTTSVPPSMPLATRINHYFQHQTERQRIVFEKVRQTLSLPTILRRRAVARDLAVDPPFAIDPDRGFAVFPPGAFPEAADIVTVTRGLGEHVDLTQPGLSKKARSGFMVPLLDTATLDLQSPFLRLAIRRDVIAAVSAYLGIVPVIAHLQVYYSAAGTDEARSSQLFHCDADGTAQVKIFVLCSDVTPANGPLTLLNARTSRSVRQRLGYHFGGKIKDRRLSQLVTPADHHPIVGPSGTVCFVDTTQCFHYGSRVQQGMAPRLVTMIQYLAPSSFMLPRDHRAGSPFRHLTMEGVPRLQQMVLGAV
jgi:hypothetical protein